MSSETDGASSIVLKLREMRAERWVGVVIACPVQASGGAGEVRRGSISTAFSGAGQTCWQMPQPVQISGTTIGIICAMFIAPGSGQRSMQTEQYDSSARQ